MKGLTAAGAMQAPLKAGVGISGDAQKLFRDFGLEMGGLVDLSEEANLRLADPDTSRWSLAGDCRLTCCGSIAKMWSSGGRAVLR